MPIRVLPKATAVGRRFGNEGPYSSITFLFAGVSIILSTPASGLITVGTLDTRSSATSVEAEKEKA